VKVSQSTIGCICMQDTTESKGWRHININESTNVGNGVCQDRVVYLGDMLSGCGGLNSAKW